MSSEAGMTENYRYGDSYSHEKNNFKFDSIDKTPSTRKEKVTVYEESNEIKNEIVYQAFMNDLYEFIENGECFKMKRVEMFLFKNLLIKYNRTQVANLTGLSIRTIRNKIKEYGLKDISINNSNL